METEIEINDAIDGAISDLERLIRQSPQEKVAYVILKMFLNTEEPSERLIRQFHDWLGSPINAQAKEAAFERCFYETLESDCMTAGEATSLK